MRHGARELDMPHTLATHLGERDLDAALLADHPAVLQALVLSAQALVVLDRPEDLGAEQAVPLRLESAVVDRLGLLYFAVGDRKSTRLNSSHLGISYAVFCLKKKNQYHTVLTCVASGRW